MGSQYSCYQHMFPFYPRVPGPVNFPWENYPGYATCILLLNLAFLNKISIDISSLTKMIASNNQTLDSTLKVLFFPLKKIDKISDCLEEADNDIKEKIS